MKRLSIFILLAVVSIYTFGQMFHYGATASSMGNTFVTGTDLLSAVSNQSSLPLLEYPAIAIDYASEFMLQELSTKSIAAAIPTRFNGTASVLISQFGFHLFHQNKIGIGYGMRFAEKITGGIQLDYLHTKIADVYGSSGLFTFEMGLRYQVNDQWSTAFHLFNPIRSRITEYIDERLTTGMTIGASYRPSEQVLLQAQVQKLIDQKPSVSAGIQYAPVDQLFVRCGINTSKSYSAASFGAGVQLQRLSIDVAGRYHQVLGFCPSSTIIYHFKNVRNEKTE